MKRKVEKYIFQKNIDGSNRIKDDGGRYLIGDDIEGCLAAARMGPASPKRGVGKEGTAARGAKKSPVKGKPRGERKVPE